MDDAVYTYDDSLQAVVVKGTDGLSYTIDGLSLRTGTIDIPNPDEYFRNKWRRRPLRGGECPQWRGMTSTR
jgi:hypothetical protein